MHGLGHWLKHVKVKIKNKRLLDAIEMNYHGNVFAYTLLRQLIFKND